MKNKYLFISHSQYADNLPGSRSSELTVSTQVYQHSLVSASEGSLSPWRCTSNFTRVISGHISRNKFIGTSCKIALMWMPQNTIDDKSTMIPDMAWCCQATIPYPRQCWPISMASQDLNELTTNHYRVSQGISEISSLIWIVVWQRETYSN